VRSATFCHGVITALAKSNVFWRFDFMSTVSGGGYIGGMVGRLASSREATTAADLQEILADDSSSSRQLNWLRANSRYLIPRGSRDWLYAIVTFLRNLVGIHIELGVMCFVIGCALGLFNVLVWFGFDQFIQQAVATVINTANDEVRVVQEIAKADLVAARLQSWQWVSQWPTLWLLLPIPIATMVYYALRYWYIPPNEMNPELADKGRQKVTERLARSLLWFCAFLGLGTVDWLAWQLAKKPIQLLLVGGGIASMLTVLRVLLPMMQDAGRTSLLKLNFAFATDLAGRLLLFVMLVFWVSVVHALLTGKVWTPPSGDALEEQIDYLAALLWVSIGMLLALLWIRVSGHSLEWLNRSSLHHFYRARLTRAYLGAANPDRDAESRVTSAEAFDDVLFSQYAPHEKGGPIHLINVCVNQTYARNGLFNLDRQGCLMTLAAPSHFITEKQSWAELSNNRHTLGTWMAVSGAAASPGLGSATRPGWAAMLTTLGVRLGYWWDAGVPAADKERRRLPKYSKLCAELLALFPGRNEPIQFLSDGGHSENTGAYALLAARCKLIVLADCGADPDYEFKDLENLVRRARMDLDAIVSFVEPDSRWPSAFGTLSNLALATSDACLAVARIDYLDDDTPGVLIVIKPNMTRNLPEDVYNYSRDNPTFPQETTADQFFSESQWESYFSLGKHLTRVLTRSLLEDVRQLATNPHTARSTAPGDKATSQRRPARIITKKAATMTLSLGTIVASLTGLLTTLQSNSASNASVDVSTLRPLYQSYGRLLDTQPNNAVAVGDTASEIMMVKWKGGRTDREISNQQKVAFDILQSTSNSCRGLALQPAACRTLLQTFVCPQVVYLASPVMQTSGYWARHLIDIETIPIAARRKTYCDEPVTQDSQNARLQSEEVAPLSPSQPKQSPALPGTSPSQSLPRMPVAAVNTHAHGAGDDSPLCAGINVYIQIYGPEGRDAARSLRPSWRAAGASVPTIEDVNDAAQRQGRSPPKPYDRPTAIYNQESSKKCADNLARLAGSVPESWAVVSINPKYKPSPNTVEVWLPPWSLAAGFDQWAQIRGYCYQEKWIKDQEAPYGLHCHPSIEACNSARGPNPDPKVVQSNCQQVDLQNNAVSLPFRGWAGSHYNKSYQPFTQQGLPQLPK